MPTFDIVSEVDMHEARNAVDQATREIGTRFDFKGVEASFVLGEHEIVMTAEVGFQTSQMLDILKNKMISRKLDISCLTLADVEVAGQRAVLRAGIQQGIEGDTARKIVKTVKEQKMKVQIAIQGEKLRVTAKKRDDLQKIMALLRDKDWGLPLQFNNFRD